VAYPKPRLNHKRWWYCRSCLAVNDGLEEGRCWNCGTPFPSRLSPKNRPWCQMGHSICLVCRRWYVTWTLPANTVLKDEPYTLGFCVFNFEKDHSGADAYFPPMLPAAYVLDANRYVYDEKKRKPVKMAGRYGK
jgi:hypothetical protein